MRSSLPVLVLAGCASPPGPLPAQAPSAPAVLPTRDCGGLFLADVHLDGVGPFTFLLDTGAAASVVDDGLRDGDQARLGLVRCGGFEARDVVARVRDLGGLSRALGAEVEGILGYPALRGWTLTFDYPLRRVSARRGALPAPDGFEVFASAGEDGPYLELEVGQRRQAVLLDTGANGGLELAHFDELLFGEGPRATAATWTVDGVRPREIGRLAHDLTFGIDVLQRPIVGRARGTPLAGASLLRHFTLTVDAAGGRFALARANEDPIRTRSALGFGLGFRTRPEGLEVIHVMAGGPGEAAGLRPGDLVETLAGRPAGLRRCEGLLRPGESGRPVALGVRRGEQRFEAAVEVGVLVR